MPLFFNPYAFTENPSVALVHTATDLAVDNDTWTLPNVSLGGEPKGGLTRHIILLITCQDNDDEGGAGFTVTLGGNAVTLVADKGITSAGTGTGGGFIGIVEMPTGSSATLIATNNSFPGTMDAWAMAAYRAVGLTSATPTDVDESAVPSDNISFTIPSGGFGVAVAVQANGGNLGTFSGTGSTTAFSGTRAGAGMLGETAGTRAYTVAGVTSTETALACAAWQLN